MTTSYGENASHDEDTDLGTLWQEALIRYYEECGTDLRAVHASRMNVNHIKADQEHQLLLFGEYRHDKGKLDKLRSLVSANSAIVLGVATHIASAASAAFPPSAAILTAFNYVMNASKVVSEDYDMVISFFDVMNSFLERISILESKMPNEAIFKKFLVNVFSALMTLSAIARKCRQKGRLSKWAKALVDGSDPKLKGAFDSLHMHLERFESATMLMTLKQTLESGKKLDTLGQDVKQIHAGVEQTMVLSQQNYVLGLESKGFAKDAASTSHEILTVVSKQEERGAEYSAGLQQVMKTLNKMNKSKGAGNPLVDAGSRKSIAMRALESLLQYNADDKRYLAEVESQYVNGTYKWFQEEDAFTGLEAGDVPLLWVSGPAGMGKSTLAYTVAKALQNEFIGDTGTSVAHYFFREDDDHKSATEMLRSCALQVASRDNGYREEVLTAIQLYGKQQENAESPNPIYRDEAKLWDLMFKTRFLKKSGRRLVLILDAADEADEKSREYLETMLKEIAEPGDSNIQVLVTSDPAVFDLSPECTKARRFEMTKGHVLPDIRAIIIGRLKILSRLRKLSQRTKRKIMARLSKKADTIRYIDHMLRRLNQIGREKAILRELDNLPSSTPELYKVLLDDCQKARTDQDVQVLRKFFAWLAYSKEPLSLGAANKLLHFIANENSISIDEELENRCARLLRLSNSRDGHDEESQEDSDSDKLDDDKAVEDDDNTSEDLQVLLSFQEKGLRGYFRPTDSPGGDKLRSSASSGHAMIFEIMDSILSSGADLQNDQPQLQLQQYAANNWCQHLQDINPGDLTQEETARIIESICSILSNRGGSIRIMERLCQKGGWGEPTCVLGKTDESIQSALETLQSWAARATKMPPAAISGATLAWIRPFVRNPKAVFIKLADAHVTNWLASYGNVYDYQILDCFTFAHQALYLGRELPAVQQNEALRAYFAKREAAPEVPVYSEESFTIVSKAFLHIDMTAQSYLSIAVALFCEDLPEPCLEQLKIGLQNTDTEMDSMEIYMRMAEIRLRLAEKEKEEEELKKENGGKKEDGEKKEDGGKDENTETEKQSNPIGRATSKTPDQDGEDMKVDKGEGDKAPESKYDQLAREALEFVTKASEIASNLPEGALEDSKIRNVVRDTWMLRAKAELFLENSDNTVAYCEKAMGAARKDEPPWHFDIVTRLGESKKWATVLEVFKVLSVDRGTTWLNLHRYRDEVHNAAKHTGRLEFVIERYRDAALIEDEKVAHLTIMINWANFYQEVVATPEAVAKAKALLNKVVDNNGSASLVTEASFRLSDILLEEFRQTTRSGVKMAAYREMRDLVKSISESMGLEFDPTQSQSVIPLAHMTRRMDAFEFQQGLERTFAGCVQALTDEMGWNDKLSMRLLARVLACVGLEEDARIAASCQVYIINMDIFKRENDIQEKSEDKAEAKEGEQEKDGEQEQEDAQEKEGEAQVNGEAADISEPPESKETEKNNKDTAETDGDDVNQLTGAISCDGCDMTIFDWSGDPVYLCYYCTEIDLCQKCFDKRAERDAGKPSEDWRILCPKGHRHIKVPAEGWKGLKDGVLRFEDREVPFHDWLTVLKEKTWPEAWEKFWSDEQF